MPGTGAAAVSGGGAWWVPVISFGGRGRWSPLVPDWWVVLVRAGPGLYYRGADRVRSWRRRAWCAGRGAGAARGGPPARPGPDCGGRWRGGCWGRALVVRRRPGASCPTPGSGAPGALLRDTGIRRSGARAGWRGSARGAGPGARHLPGFGWPGGSPVMTGPGTEPGRAAAQLPPRHYGPGGRAARGDAGRRLRRPGRHGRRVRGRRYRSGASGRGAQPGWGFSVVDIAGGPRPARDLAAVARGRRLVARDNPDVLHAHGSGRVRSRPWPGLAGNCNDAGCDFVQNAPAAGGPGRRRVRGPGMIAARRADAVLTVSGDGAAWLRGRGAWLAGTGAAAVPPPGRVPPETAAVPNSARGMNLLAEAASGGGEPLWRGIVRGAGRGSPRKASARLSGPRSGGSGRLWSRW